MTPPVADPHEDALHHLSAADERLAAVIARHGPCRIGHTTRQPFESLVGSIVSQQLSTKAAATIFARVKALGANERGEISPDALLAVPEPRLREAGLSGSKLAYIRDLSTRVRAGELALDALDTMSDDEVIASLCRVKGIGRWTAEMFLIFRLGRPDVLPVDDLGIQKGMMRLFGLRKLPSPERMVKLAKPFRPYRSIACWYLWRLHEEKPATTTR